MTVVGGMGCRANPIAVSRPTGFVVPLYSYPTSGGNTAHWNTLRNAKIAFPQIPMFAILNPGNGPNLTVDNNYTSGIAYLQSVGIKCLGYVFTSYGIGVSGVVTHDETQCKNDVSGWKTLYPTMDGIMFDECANTNNSGMIAFYTRQYNHVKANNLQYVVQNPGADTLIDYMSCSDIITVSEGALNYPTIDTTFKNKWAPYKRRVHVEAYSMSGLQPFSDASGKTWFNNANKAVGYIYLTEDGLDGNAWDSTTGNMSGECSLLLSNR